MADKILLMGGTGWLGHNIATQLQAKGADVTILSRGKKSTFTNDVNGIKMITADKKSEAEMIEVLKTPYTHIIDTVPTVESIELVHKYAKSLVHYVHCSSTGGYTPLPFIPCNETAPYGGFGIGTGWDQKRIVDNMVIDLYKQDGFPATVIRPCYITGPGMLPIDNFGDRGKDFLRKVLAEETLELPGDGQTLLQPIHVRDLARSFLLAMDHTDKCKGEIYNITLAYAVTLTRYLELTAAAFGKKANIKCMPAEDILQKYGSAVGKVNLMFLTNHMCFTPEKAKQDMGYIPSCTPEEAIAETALWGAKELGLI